MNDSPRRVGQDATGAEEDQFKQQNSTASSEPFQSEKNSTVAFRQTTDETACRSPAINFARTGSVYRMDQNIGGAKIQRIRIYHF